MHITKQFQTERSIFFISDELAFDFIPLDGGGILELFSTTSTTISLTCSLVMDEEDIDTIFNSIEIYINEYPTPDAVEDHQLIYNGVFSIPSQRICISSFDIDEIFLHSFDNQEIHLKIYIGKNYEENPDHFVVVLNDLSPRNI